MSAEVWIPIWLTFKLALLTTVILLILGTPLAWWLVTRNHLWQRLVEVVVALPLVLPPTVLGFYLLLLLAPDGLVGMGWGYLSSSPLVFSFGGLLIGSILYSLPFVVQPLTASFRQLNDTYMDVAASLGASFLDTFFSVVVPLCKRGFLVAATLGFAHTVGEFGVVLMIGGNIPSETQLLSIAIYEQVEILNYRGAHIYSIGLLAFCLVTLWLVYRVDQNFNLSGRR